MLKRSLAPDTQEPSQNSVDAEVGGSFSRSNMKKFSYKFKHFQRQDVRMAVVKALLEEMDKEGLSQNACVTPTWIMRKLFPQGAAATAEFQ